MRFPFRFRFRRQPPPYGFSQRRPARIRGFLWRLVPRFRWPFSRSQSGLYGASDYGGNYGPTRYGENVPAAQQPGLFRRLLRWPFRLLRRLTRSAAALVHAMLRVVLFPFRLVAAMRGHREWRHLLFGMPAVVGLVTMGVVALRIDLQASVLLEAYDREALSAFQKEDWEKAKLMYDRLLLLANSDRPRANYNLGIVLERQGEMERAFAIMRQIAPADTGGFAQAHRWLAEKALQVPDTLRSEEARNVLKAHYEHARLRLPRDPTIYYGLAQCYIAAGVVSKASENLLTASRLSPEYYFSLGLWQHRINQRKRARVSFEQAAAYYASVVARDPENATARFRWASCQTNLGNPRESLRILAEGAQLDKSTNYAPAMAYSCVYIFDFIQGAKAVDHQVRLSWLRQALRHVPNFPPALTRLSAYAVGQADEEVAEMLEVLLTTGANVAFVHFVAGIRNWKTGDQDKSLFYFSRAYKLDPKMAGIGNNLAWVLSQKEHPDLERALKIIESVLRVEDKNPQYRDTRGQIFVKLSRWEEALDDLEFALQAPAMSANKGLHQALADTYEALGQESLASKHRQILDRLPQ
ncbi:MAG: tetratricopeptide repeat protein [Planctomycetota bacterium]|nr:tetratricopeptide repeat protein [Planctomycetota bacterium]